MRYITFLFILLNFSLWLAGAVYAVDDPPPQKIVISTFDAGSAGKYKYLRDGVQGMLVSRLSAKEGVEVLDQRISEQDLTDLKRGLKGSGEGASRPEADYLVTGALFALKKGLNIQVAFYPLSGEGEVSHFSTLAENDGAIISKIDQLSEDIAVKVFGQDKNISNTPDSEQGAEGTSGFITVHPEAAYKKGLYSGSIVGIGDSAVKVSSRGVRRTGEVATEMIAMAVGDVDGDGKTEIVLLSERELRILQFTGRDMREVAKTKLPHSTKVHAINIADHDKNGKMEIYLSATQDLAVSSLIMEWDKTVGFSTVNKNIPWYIRPIDHPERGLILAGQQRGHERVHLVKKGVFQLSLKPDNSFAAESELVLPRSVNLFDFFYVDIDGDKGMETVTIDQNQKLRIYDQENGLLWVSSENYGGSKTYIGPRQGGATEQQGTTRSLSVDENFARELVFLPGRIAVADVDKNGRQDIVVVSNVDAGFSFFKRLRLYDGGSIVGLTWNGSALVETWRTGRQSGYIADFDFKLKTDEVADNKGKTGVASLYIGQIPNSGTLEALIPGSDSSIVTLRELGFSRTK